MTVYFDHFTFNLEKMFMLGPKTFGKNYLNVVVSVQIHFSQTLDIFAVLSCASSEITDFCCFRSFQTTWSVRLTVYCPNHETTSACDRTWSPIRNGPFGLTFWNFIGWTSCPMMWLITFSTISFTDLLVIVKAFNRTTFEWFDTINQAAGRAWRPAWCDFPFGFFQFNFRSKIIFI